MTDQTPPSPDLSGSYHYRLIARAMAEIDAAGGARLPLDDLAARLGMSTAHFQRLFSQWVGVSPKRYQQYLALGHARQLLAERATLAEAAEGAGLSTASRLHDLFLRWEAMTPGAHARRGAGLDISWGVFDSPFGPAVAMATERGLCGLGFAAETGVKHAFDDLAARWPAARYSENSEAL
ncbi:MAG: helix-turn-helix transcriptional regulator, partial [Gammaproteobacteria bacterium]|nr:helix-turn-helix transcriptional regulator [Gammaproteobacteria bacterium]